MKHEKLTKQCRICGKDFVLENSLQYSRQFCFDCVPHTEDAQLRTNYKRRAVKQQAIKMLGGKCLKCGCEEPYLLNFHHIDPSQKDASPSRLIASSKIEEFFQEIQGCILLCSNCHQRFHWLESEKGITIEQYVDIPEFCKVQDSINHKYSRIEK